MVMLVRLLARAQSTAKRWSLVQPPLKKAIRSPLSLPLAMPAKAMPLPGAKSAGDLSHLSRLPSVHFRVALAARAEE